MLLKRAVEFWVRGCVVVGFEFNTEVCKVADKVRVTLIKSPIGAIPKHRKTVAALGLTKMHKTVELPNNAATQGMVNQVRHMVKVEEV